MQVKTPIKTIEEMAGDEDFAFQVMEMFVREQERLSDIMDGLYMRQSCPYREEGCDYISCDYCDKAAEHGD